MPAANENECGRNRKLLADTVKGGRDCIWIGRQLENVCCVAQFLPDHGDVLHITGKGV